MKMCLTVAGMLAAVSVATSEPSRSAPIAVAVAPTSPGVRSAAPSTAKQQTLLRVSGFRFLGATAFSPQELTKALSAYEGKWLDAGRLPEVADAVADAYQKSGRHATASVSEQEVHGGVVTVRVVESPAGLRGGSGHIATGTAQISGLDLLGRRRVHTAANFVPIDFRKNDREPELTDPGTSTLAALRRPSEPKLANAARPTLVALRDPAKPVRAHASEPKPLEAPAPKPVAATAPTDVRPEAPEAKEPEASGPSRARVQKISFSGNSAIGDDALNAIAGPQQGKDLSLTELQSVAKRVTQHYRDEGYFLAQAVVPQQDVQDGEVNLRILEGRLGDITVTGNERYREKYIRQAFSELKRGEPLRREALERALMVLNETSGIRATSVLSPGKEIGTTDLTIEVTERIDPRGSWEFNNFGTKMSSEYRVSPSVTFPNVSGRGDSLGLSLVSGPDHHDLFYGQVSYATPIAADGTKLTAHMSAGGFEVGQEFAVLGIEGEGFAWGLGASRPLLRSRAKSITLEGGIEFDDSEQSLLGALSSEDRIRKLRLGVNVDQKDNTGRSFFSFGVQQGLGELFGGMPDNSPLSSRSFSFADGRFTKFVADYTRLQRLNSRVMLIGRCGGQYSTRALVVGEQWAIGGPDSVRGHPTSAFLGDSGLVLSLEARIAPLPKAHEYYDDFQVAVFVDHGTVFNKRPGTGQSSSHSISGIGVGVRANLPDDFAIRADLGFHLGTPPRSGDSVVPHFQVTRKF